MLKLVNQGTKTHAIAQQDKLILVLCALLASPCEQSDCARPFCMGEVCFASEGMEVVYKRCNKLACTPIGCQTCMKVVDTVLGLLVTTLNDMLHYVLVSDCIS